MHITTSLVWKCTQCFLENKNDESKQIQFCIGCRDVWKCTSCGIQNYFDSEKFTCKICTMDIDRESFTRFLKLFDNNYSMKYMKMSGNYNLFELAKKNASASANVQTSTVSASEPNGALLAQRANSATTVCPVPAFDPTNTRPFEPSKAIVTSQFKKPQPVLPPLPQITFWDCRICGMKSLSSSVSCDVCFQVKGKVWSLAELKHNS